MSASLSPGDGHEVPEAGLVAGSAPVSPELLNAVFEVGGELSLERVLQRMVEAAVRLVDCEYGALGVLGPDRDLKEFLTVGVTPRVRAEIGPPPRGHGILGLIIKDPRPLRLHDLSRHPESCGFPPHHPVMQSFLGVPVRARGEVFGNLYLTQKRGGDFTDDDERVVLALAAAAGIAIENARLYDQAEQTGRFLKGIAEVATRLLSDPDSGSALHLVAAHARELAGADACAILLPRGNEFVAAAGDALPAQFTSALPVPHDGGVLGTALDSGEVAAIRDLRSVLGAPEDADQLAVPALAIPLDAARGVSGILLIINQGAHGGFAADPLAALQAFATQAALVLEVAESRRSAELLLVLQDRDRIARDLHDLVIQKLFATGMQLESMTRLIDNEDVARRIHVVVDDLDDTIRQIRSTIYSLQHLGRHNAIGLRAEILALAEEFTRSAGFEPSIRMDGLIDGLVPDDLANDLVAALREALSNAARHSGASGVDIRVIVRDGYLVLTVSDNGRGLGDSGRRSGLANIEERAHKNGGTVLLDTSAGGLALTWRVPISPPH